MTALIGVPIIRTGAGRLNPTTKLLGLIIIAVPLLLSIDLVSSGILAAVGIVALPLLGVGPRTLLRTAWPIALGLAGLWFATWVVMGSFGGLVPVSVRLVALGLPGLLLVTTTDPVDLADALVQRWHLSPRFAYGALAGFRLLPLLITELGTMIRARRARGMTGGLNPLRWLQLGGGLLFGLLVQAIRRAVRLAAAMDSRGFGVTRNRTYARPSTTSRADAWFITAVVVVVAVAVSASLATGRWHLLFT